MKIDEIVAHEMNGDPEFLTLAHLFMEWGSSRLPDGVHEHPEGRSRGREADLLDAEGTLVALLGLGRRIEQPVG